MKEVIIFTLNKNHEPVFLTDLISRISNIGDWEIYKFYIPNHIGEAPAEFPKNWAVNVLQEAEINTVKTLDVNSTDYDSRIIINLTNLPDVTSFIKGATYFNCSILDGYCHSYFPKLIDAIISEDDVIQSRITLQNLTGKLSSLRTGTFKIIKYDYPLTLEILIQGTIQLLAESINDFQKGILGENLTAIHKSKNSSNLIKETIHKVSKATLKHRIDQLFFTQKWNIGIIKKPIAEVALSTTQKFEVEWLKESSGNDFAADPFGYVENGVPQILFEKYLDGKGILQISSFDKPPVKLIDLDVHASYPYLFNYLGQWYCLPEQHASGKLELYKFNTEERKLNRHCTILQNFKAVDPSIIHYNDKWWLFCTNAEEKGADLRLYIFHALQLEGPWVPHPENPVKTDISSARPAGHLFVHHNILYRPSQDSSRSYGGAIKINKIELLDENNFRESIVNKLDPSQLNGSYTEGWHTLSSCGEFTLVDGKRKALSVRNLLKIIRKK